jgi:AcrR family transcriptional regulator
MAKQSAAIRKLTQANEPDPDGRRQRSQASRSKIIAAFMELMEAGDPSPSAARVAKHAGVGLRSVFRHFDDMDSIYVEVDRLLGEQWSPVLNKPYKSTDWRDQLNELIKRRAEVNENTSPYRLTTMFARFHSAQLMKNYERLMKIEADALNAILPKSVQKDKRRSRAVLLATSFDSWRLFRHDQGLSNKRTIETMAQIVKDIIAHIDD